MAFTTCPHCKGTYFEIKEVEPRGAAYKTVFIQCSGCGAPFAAQDYFNIGSLLQGQEKKIADLSRKVDQLDYNIQEILQGLQRLQR